MVIFSPNGSLMPLVISLEIVSNTFFKSSAFFAFKLPALASALNLFSSIEVPLSVLFKAKLTVYDLPVALKSFSICFSLS